MYSFHFPLKKKKKNLTRSKLLLVEHKVGHKNEIKDLYSLRCYRNIAVNKAINELSQAAHQKTRLYIPTWFIFL